MRPCATTSWPCSGADSVDTRTVTEPTDVDLVEVCHDLGWTDGLPVVPPTRDRTTRMLGEHAGRADEVVAVLPPGDGPATLGRIAANAVMAGCLPAHLPAVVAAVRAVADPRFKLDRVVTTASSQAPMVLITGPEAAAIGLDGGFDALGSSTRANATIGRALQLVLRNIASSRAGGLPHATLGHPGHRGFCFTENAALSPWEPYHASRGLMSQASAVTVYPAESPLCIVDMGRTDPEEVLRTIIESSLVPGVYNWFFREELWFLMSPQHAVLMAEAGWDRDRVRDALYRGLRLPANRLRGRGLYGYVDASIPPVWLNEASEDGVPIVDAPDRIRIAVTGGAFGGYTAVVFGEGESVTVPIDSDLAPVAVT